MKKTVSIIGGGSAALLFAAHINSHKYKVTLYEQNTALGRKLLVAGKGGFNLTHSEALLQFTQRYTPTHLLQKPIEVFSNTDLIKWLKSIGIETFIGSSKRVYPVEGITPIEVLNAITALIKKNNVGINTNVKWEGWNEKGALIFNNNQVIKSDYTIFALGGASWKNTGSNGNWKDIFQQNNINTIPFQPSNCAYKVIWQDGFINNYEGTPLKNIALSCNNKTQKGELIISKFGLEGNAIYALSRHIREQLNTAKKAKVYIDLKPDVNIEVLATKFKNSELKKTSDILRKTLNLTSYQVALLKSIVSKEEFLNTKVLISKIKSLPIEITDFGPIDEAISTVGGISLKAIDSNFELKNMKNHYCIGEMLDYDAPTGGYLLQSCFSMGVYLARYLNEI